MEDPSKNRNKPDELALLFAESTPRAPAPPDAEQTVRAAIQAEWETVVRKRKQQRFVALGIAASLLASVLAAVLFSNSATPGAQLAIIERISGTVMVATGNQQPRRASVEDSVAIGSTVGSDGGGSVALSWQGQISLRLDRGTIIRLISEKQIELLQGGLYVDTQASASVEQPAPELRIDAAGIQLKHLGTQYMMEFRDNLLTASVRSGSVALTREGNEQIAPAGNAITMATDGVWSQGKIETFGSAWAWAEDISPKLHVQGQSLSLVLDWAARETGREIYYASRAARVLAESKTMQSDADLEVVTALQVLTMTSDLRAMVDGARIIVDLKKNAAGSDPTGVP